MPNKQKTWDRSSGPVPQTWSTYQRNAATGNYVYVGQGSGTGNKKIFDYTTRSWVTFPGWKAFRAANGYLPTQPMSEVKAFVKGFDNYPVYLPYSSLQYKVELLTPEYLAIPSYFGMAGASGPSTYSTAERLKCLDDAKQKCLAKARDMKVNLPVLLGEGRQTVSMIAETARTLGRAYSAFRRDRFKQAAKILGIPKPSRTSSNHWLAYAYGWMPLLSDAEGAYRLVTQGLMDPSRGPRFSVKAQAKMEKRSKTTYTSGTSKGGNCVLTLETYVKAHAGLLLEFTTRATGLQSVGMGRYDPLLTAWELTPFSFVFDWFVDIGGFLETLSALEGMTVLAGFGSHLESVYGRGVYKDTATHKVVSGAPESGIAWRSYSRQNWDGSALYIRTPLWDGLNARRIVTTAALWRQRCRGDRVFGKYFP